MTFVKPLEGLLVIDFSQFLSGPSAGLRLADLGARVIKVERPGSGDICRTLYISNVVLDGDSSIFHAINRNKESIAADLKNPQDLEFIKKLLVQADVVIQNFRPEVMERLGLHYEAVKEINPSIIYGEVSGYGAEGPWKDAPGQDLLAQSRSGLLWLKGGSSGRRSPEPFGLAVADMMAGAHLAQGILACLVRRSVTGEGALVQVSLLESILDLQCQELSAYLHSGVESLFAAAQEQHDTAAKSGIYQTKDGYLAIAEASFEQLSKLLECPELFRCTEPQQRRQLLTEKLAASTTQGWLKLLEPANIPSVEVLNWDQLMAEEGFQALGMIQEIERTTAGGRLTLSTTRCPIRVDGQAFTSRKGAPNVGEDTDRIKEEVFR